MGVQGGRSLGVGHRLQMLRRHMMCRSNWKRTNSNEGQNHRERELHEQQADQRGPGPLDAELRTLAGPRKSGSDGAKGRDGRGAADRAPSGGRGALLQDWRTWGRQDADGGADGGGRRDDGFLEKAGS